MSTRCQIGFYISRDSDLDDFDVLLYRHWDGYPDSEHGVVAAILPFLKKFNKERGLVDTEYAAANLMHHLIQAKRNQGDEDFLGYGISKGFHGDIDYFYKVSPTHLDVYTGNRQLLESHEIAEA